MEAMWLMEVANKIEFVRDSLTQFVWHPGAT